MRVRTELGELHVDDTGGDRPVVVLWHSFLASGAMWRGVAPALARSFRVLNVDAPGHGESAVARVPVTMDACADAVAAILDAAGVRRASICGLSWGGMTGMAFALRHPDRLRALVLADTSCRRESLRNVAEYELLGLFFRRFGAPPWLTARIAPLFFCDRTLRERPELVDEFRAYVQGLDRESVWRALQCIVGRPSRERALAACRAPTLVVVGAGDRAQPAEQSQAIARAIPGARLLVLPDAGHLSALEQPAAFAEAALEFLHEHAPLG
jgi:pimeloyl-ACP methyl ester carboxylesterase